MKKKTNKFDSQGRKIGFWIDYYHNGHIWSKGKFKKDFPVGVWQFNNPEGELHIEILYIT